MKTVDDVLREIKEAEERLEKLREELVTLTTVTQPANGPSTTTPIPETSTTTSKWPFPASDYQRYARQMIVPEIGLSGQSHIRSSSVLIVGLGGLGCPAARYLAGAGVRRIGLVDGDLVEASNLHRQILHTTARVGVSKVVSAARGLAEAVAGSAVAIEPHSFHLTPQNAVSLFARYDLILDCTDHPTSRYLISDAAVLAGKPLVSASALKTDGQLIVLNYPARAAAVDRASSTDASNGGTADDANTPREHGPCYRCVFPKPPPPETLVSCGEGGILGPVVGTMGVLQALEALKILARGIGGGGGPAVPENPTLLIFSAYGSPQFRSLRMRPRRKDCVACGDSPTVTRDSLASGGTDYVAFCGVAPPVDVLPPDQRIAPDELARWAAGGAGGGVGEPRRRYTLIDVRDRTQFELASIPGSINVPYMYFESGQIRDYRRRQEPLGQVGGVTARIPDDGSDLLLVCRMGNDSQVAAKRLVDLGYAREGTWIGDVKGGLRAWRRDVEPDFPDF